MNTKFKKMLASYFMKLGLYLTYKLIATWHSLAGFNFCSIITDIPSNKLAICSYICDQIWQKVHC